MVELTRRGFLVAMLAAGAAPAFVRASSLMKVIGIVVPEKELVVAARSAIIVAPAGAEKFGQMSMPSMADMLEGRTRKLMLNGCEYTVYRRQLDIAPQKA